MSLGGKQTETQSIDPDLKRAALANLEMAKKVGQLGFVPYTGATVAGMQPAQIAAMQGTNMGAEAFGLPTSAIPTGGDLSPYAMYQEALANMAPAQRAFIESMFINPTTGAAPTMTFGAQPPAAPDQSIINRIMSGGGGGGSYMPITSSNTRSLNTPLSYLPGGVNTRNPSSLVNTTAARLTSPTQKAPTSAQRPVSRSTAR